MRTPLGSLFQQFLLGFAKFVVGVQGRDFVAFRQSRIIKDRREEVLEPAFRIEYGLPNVNKLGGSRPDRMHAQ